MFSQDLENSIRNHSEERLDKIQELGNELIEHECMAASISAEVTAIIDRWDTLLSQVCFIGFSRKLNLFLLQIGPKMCFYKFKNVYLIQSKREWDYIHTYQSQFIYKN